MGVVILVVGFPPVAMLAWQWGEVLQATVFPESTCWLRQWEGEHKIFRAEAPAAIAMLGIVPWAAVALFCAGVMAFAVSDPKIRRLIAVCVVVALASIGGLYFGTDDAADFERSAYIDYRDKC